MSKHTPGPWRIEELGNGKEYRIYGSGTPNKTIGDKIENTIGWTKAYNHENPTGMANAHRIVDCVNACEGIDDVAKQAPKIQAAPEMWEMLVKATKLLMLASDACIDEQESPDGPLWGKDDDRELTRIKNYVEHLSDEI